MISIDQERNESLDQGSKNEDINQKCVPQMKEKFRDQQSESKFSVKEVGKPSKSNFVEKMYVCRFVLEDVEHRRNYYFILFENPSTLHILIFSFAQSTLWTYLGKQNKFVMFFM